MKLNIPKLLPVICVFVVSLLFASVLTISTKPMEDVSLDLSLMISDGENPDDFNDHGWTVFSQKGETVTELTGNGMGSYTGIEPGDTLYFSRVMAEELDSPTMQLGSINRNFAVFLDGELVYTDCPSLDNRIGYLELPMKEWDEMEPLTISLPADYQGKTLTIAQSTPLYSETSIYRAYPADVRLYCGYSYESGLIAESFSTAFLAAAFFLAGVLLLISFVRSRRIGTVCMAILNSKLSAALDAGIHADIIKTEAPETLPLTDADLCSVVMNIMDNALAGAAASGISEPFLRLDFHVSGNFFVFICENVAHADQANAGIKETVPKHGLGLRIVHSIADRYEGLVDTEQNEGRYRIRVALPLL